MKNKRIVVVAVMILALSLALPVSAGTNMGLQVNGKAIDGADLLVENGVTLISVKTLEQLSEAEVSLTDQTLMVSEQQVQLPSDVVTRGEARYVPLRFVGEALGYKVNWVPGLINVEKEQLKDGMTAAEVLVKSNQQAENINTYAMVGSLEQQMNAQLEEDEDLTLDMHSEFTGSIQSEPIQVYMKQTMEMLGEETEELEMDLATETYLDEEYMYMKMPGEDQWLKQPHFLPMAALKEQQEVSSDPLRAMNQMLEMGMALSFDDDISLDGQDYYVINADIDMQKLMESQQELLQQIMGNMSGMMNSVAAIPEEDMELFSSILSTIIAEIMENADLDYYYTAYIEKQTFLPGMVDYNMNLKVDLDAKELLATISEALGEEFPEEMLEEIPEKLKLDIAQKGQFKLLDFGKEFVKPDVSGAISFEDYYSKNQTLQEDPS
jgi:hypothetical protein